MTQADGEIIGGAIEISGWVTIDVLPLIKGKKVNTPRFENDEYIMSVGSIRPLDDCLRIAYGDMVDWLMETMAWIRQTLTNCFLQWGESG